MKKLKNVVAVIVCLSVFLTVPAHAQLTSNESGWLNSINQNLNLLKTYFNSTSLANNPIAYYLIQIEDEVETWHGNARSFYQKFDVGGRVDDYFWDWTSLFSTIANQLSNTNEVGTISNYLDLYNWTFASIEENNRRLVSVVRKAFEASSNNSTESIYSMIAQQLDAILQAFDAETHGTSKDIYSMLFEAYEDLILPADTLGKTIYELLYDMHTELGGYEEGNYGLTLYGTLNEQLKLLKLREPIWEFELEEFLKNKDNYDQIEHIFTNGQDTDTSLGMGSIRALGDLLSTTNSDLKSVGSVDDFITNWEAVNADGDEWFSIETQNALDTVSSVVLFFDDEDPYNMNGYMERWGVLTDVIR